MSCEKKMSITLNHKFASLISCSSLNIYKGSLSKPEMRAPSFLGLRDDKDPKEVVREKPFQ